MELINLCTVDRFHMLLAMLSSPLNTEYYGTDCVVRKRQNGLIVLQKKSWAEDVESRDRVNTSDKS